MVKEKTLHASGLPMVTLWPEGEGPKLDIINSEDFPLQKVLEGLGISTSPLRGSFGITDEAAIRARLELVEYLHQSPAISECIRKITLPRCLPSGESAFLEEFPRDRRSRFWVDLDAFVLAVAQSTNPPRIITDLAENFRKMSAFEASERETTAKLADAVQQMAKLRALLRLPLSVGYPTNATRTYRRSLTILPRMGREEPRVVSLYGYKKYGEFVSKEDDLNSIRDRELSSWNPLRYMLIAWKFCTFPLRSRKAKRASVVFYPEDDSIVRDVTADFNQRLAKVKTEELGPHFFLYASVQYSESGMQATVLGIQQEPPDLARIKLKREQPMDYSGFSWRQVRSIRKGQKRSMEIRSELERKLDSAALLQRIRTASPGFVNNMSIDIPSPQTDAEYRWSGIDALYNLEEHKPVTATMSNYRDYVFKHMKMLKDIVSLLDSIKRAAKTHKIPVCVPRLTTNHVIAGQGLVPIQLMMKAQQGKIGRIVPMNGMPELNGRAIVVTGLHGEGKTELLHSLPVNVFLAQSGILVLGSSFMFNVKKAVGLLFINKSEEGSIIQVILLKIDKIIDGIAAYQPHEVVVVLDELGTATQEGSGEKLAQQLLTGLSEKGVSVIFSTQIQSLAHFAVDNLNAIPIRLFKKHTILNGIGDGRLDDLVKQSGLQKKLATMGK